MQYQSVIIDDEKLNIEYLSGLLNIYCPDIQIVATATNVKDGIKTIIQHKPQIVFLDIEIHDQTGFDVLNAVDDYELQVILVSAHDKYSFKAFKYAVIDYILKPVNIEELIDAVKRCKKRIQKDGTGYNAKKDFFNEDEFLSVHHKEQIELIPLSDIIHLDSLGGYTEINTIKNKKIITSKTLKDYEMYLPASKFYRVHSGHIVNRQHIVKYIRSKFGTLIMSNDIEIPVSHSKKKEVSDWFNF